ncbi:unnamed protein product [Urochloa decumbens]|uniref:RNA helicase n=1 Tax=Urochloa decumbens TaxID=240449 RepID=A0ABC9DZV8_9POAL
MGTYLRNHSDYEFSCANDKPQVEFMDFQNDGVPTHCDPSFGHVLITVPFPFNGSKPNFVLVGGTYSDSITIQNTSSESEFLFAIRIYASSPENSFFSSINRPPADDANEEAKKAFVSSVSLGDITLIRGNPLTIWLTCMPKDIGLHTSIVHFSFGDVLTIRVALLLADDNVSKALSSDKPYYSRCPQLTNFEYAPIVPCIHEHGVIKQRFSVPFGDLSMTNYLQTFMSLLRMEQDNLKELMKSYDMHDVSIKTGTKHHCFIQLPGLAERRPSLIRGDNIIAAYVGRHSQTYKVRHFTHIFLDDAGQVSEPETMIPLSGLCARDTVVVLAGDPMQLGPVVYCKEAEKGGLQRLLDSKPYKTGKSDYVTQLMRNYRCHLAILALPSKLFYSGELIAHKDDKVPLIYDHIGLPNRLFPVLFVGVQGCNEMESSDPSWFNMIEVSKVVSLIGKLRSGGVREADIGVIAPFRLQVYKIKQALKELDMTDLKVGNVEQFVGEEREIMIVSTVRTTVKFNEFDNFLNLGILNNHRSFNVAISRAKSLLIIVGNPYIITKDWHWSRLLKHCDENGSYQGCPLPPPDNGSYQGSS